MLNEKREAVGRRRTVARWVVVLAALGASGCVKAPVWQTPAALRAPDSAVAAALGDVGRSARPIDPALIPGLPMPSHLRPCCAFGTDLKVTLGTVPIPGFTLDNMRGPDDLGPHTYNRGVLTVDASDERGVIDTERNGLVYTCRGGFIDIAHVRDHADLTVFLTAAIARHMEQGGVINLPKQGGRAQVTLHPIDAQRIKRTGRRRLALAMAQWLAFHFSVWHEIASWYGYGALSGVPEKVSAFSPEDLYSNLLGIKLAGGIVTQREMSDERQYNRAMDAWIAQALARLRAVPKPAGVAAMRALDGRWWDSSKRIPDWQLVRRRNLALGATLKPWVVAQAYPAGQSPDTDCANTSVLVLRNPDGFEGIRFDKVATFEVDVGKLLARSGFPFPRADSRRITQADFPAIVAQIRRENEQAMGLLADRPTPPFSPPREVAP